MAAPDRRQKDQPAAAAVCHRERTRPGFRKPGPPTDRRDSGRAWKPPIWPPPSLAGVSPTSMWARAPAACRSAPFRQTPRNSLIALGFSRFITGTGSGFSGSAQDKGWVKSFFVRLLARKPIVAMIRKKAGFVIWLTGLSGSGKTTLARSAADTLNKRGCLSVVLDGDDLRKGLCRDLGYSLNDRAENVRRVAAVARLFQNVGFIAIVALISPTSAARQNARDIIGIEHFFEVWCRCPLACCENRDLRNLYQLARSGKIKEFTGVTSVYEDPSNPQLIIDTDRFSPKEGLKMLLRGLQDSRLVSS